jgi:hypothetical protein
MNFEIPVGWNQIYVDVFADLEKAKSKEIKLNHLSKEEEEHRRVGNRLKRLRRRHLINAALRTCFISKNPPRFKDLSIGQP